MKSTSGFTLVELLIAIVVIAILATIGMVSYGNIKRNAYDAKVDTALDQAQKLVAIFDARNTLSPTATYNIWTAQDMMKSQGMINDDFINQLKDSSPMRAYGVSGKDNYVRILWCGGRRYLLIAEVYGDGISETEYNSKTQQCYTDNYNWNRKSGGGFGSSTTSQPRHFRAKELKFD